MKPDDFLCDRKYRLIRVLGEGAYGEVWLAEETRSRTQVALKFARAENAEASERFTREIKLSRNIEHPHLLRADTVEQCDGALFLVLPFLPGGSLKDRLEQKGPMTSGQVLPLARQAAEALGYLHAKDIIHRDVHPGNLLFTADGQLKLADLGLAQTADTSYSLWSGTRTERHPGNIFYQPPEAIAQGHVLMPLRPAADVYMLGAVLWEMLTGRIYFNNLGNRPRQISVAVPVELDDLVMSCLAPDEGRRPDGGGALAGRLAGVEKQLYSRSSAQRAIPSTPPGQVQLKPSAAVEPRTATSEPVQKQRASASGTVQGTRRRWLGLTGLLLLALLVIIGLGLARVDGLAAVFQATATPWSVRMPTESPEQAHVTLPFTDTFDIGLSPLWDKLDYDYPEGRVQTVGGLLTGSSHAYSHLVIGTDNWNDYTIKTRVKITNFNHPPLIGVRFTLTQGSVGNVWVVEMELLKNDFQWFYVRNGVRSQITDPGASGQYVSSGPWYDVEITTRIFDVHTTINGTDFGGFSVSHENGSVMLALTDESFFDSVSITPRP